MREFTGLRQQTYRPQLCARTNPNSVIAGEVIRRIAGRPPGGFFAEEIAGPLGADFHIGLAAEHDHRVAPGIAPPSSPSGD